MHRRAIAGCLVGAVAVVACSTLPGMKVETQHDPAAAAQLRSYRTYAWPPAVKQGAASDVTAAIMRSVDETLADRGYRQETSRPDFLVRWHVSAGTARRTTTTMEAPVFRDTGPMPSIAPPSPPGKTTREYREGTLILDVLDSGSQTVVWRGSAQAELSGVGDAATREARIKEAVRQILDRFPPR